MLAATKVLIATAQSCAAGAAAGGPTEYWLGGLFDPEPFITASRQHTAQRCGLALDQLAKAVHAAVHG